MVNFRIAAKAFVIDDDKLLILKRADDDMQKPGIWELPGGRLEVEEDPKEGLKREVKEECGIDIEVKQPLNIRHFTRDDGQIITMIIFLCKLGKKSTNSDVVLSDEHSEHEWIDMDKCKSKLADFFHEEVDVYDKYFKDKFSKDKQLK